MTPAAPVHQTELLVKMLEDNTRLTESIKALTERVEQLNIEMHGYITR